MSARSAAETDPTAAHHALTARLARDAIDWAVLATDGAAHLINHAGDDWGSIAQYDIAELAALLTRIQDWENNVDPSGSRLPRAKRHDDKTIAAIRSVWK